MIEVPKTFVTPTVEREGQAGQAWIDRLPRLVADLCERWGLTVDGAPMHGYLGVVVPVRQRGAPRVLKVSWIDEETADEAVALAAWNGNGAVRLYARDPEHGAMLLERLDPTRTLAELPIDEAVDTAADLLRRLAIENPNGIRTGLRTWAATSLDQLPALQRELGDPLPFDVLDAALTYAEVLGPSAGSLLLSRDMHYWNVLAGSREPWLLIDPKPIVGDPEFGLAPLLWRRTGQPPGEVSFDETSRRLARLVERAGLDIERAKGWTLLRCADYALRAQQLGLTLDAAICRQLAHWLANG